MPIHAARLHLYRAEKALFEALALPGWHALIEQHPAFGRRSQALFAAIRDLRDLDASQFDHAQAAVAAGVSRAAGELLSTASRVLRDAE